MDELDWRWVKSFVAVATHGSLGAAAKASHTSAPTLSRHLTSLEAALGVDLFDRGGRGLRLSDQGRELLAHARHMSLAAATLTREALSLRTQTSGSVRVTMTETFGAYFAPAWLKDLRRAHPEITIELSLQDTAADLLLNEAEIAVRLFTPQQSELVMKRCGTHARGIYASAAYLDAHGTPTDPAQLPAHDLIGFDLDEVWRDASRGAGLGFEREDFTLRTDAHAMHPLLAREGLGIAVVQHFTARRLGLVRVLPDIDLHGGPVLLVMHPSLRANPVVSKIWSHLGLALEGAFG